MDNGNMASEIIIPEWWYPTNDWDSHRPMLYLAAYYCDGNIVELGCGAGSTNLLYSYWLDHPKSDAFASLETNPEYTTLFSHTTDLVDSYYDAMKFMPCGLLFIDCAPGELRKYLIDYYRNCAQFIVVHDTEPGAEYVYGMADALSKFLYRCDLVIKGMPQTTAVSNVYDVSTWKGIYNDKFHFV